MFFIKSLNYEEDYFHQQTKQRRRWRLEGLAFSQFTILTGLNSSGKTRTCNIIKNTISRIVNPLKPQLGKTEMTISVAEDRTYRYTSDIHQDESFNNFVKDEELWWLKERGKNRMLFNRKKILNSRSNRLVSYSPPDDQLTFHARRDKVHHTYIEDIIDSAKQFYFLDFEEPKVLARFTQPLKQLPQEILPSMTPLFFEGLVDKEKKNKIIDEINRMGFPIKDLFVRPLMIAGQEIPDLYIEEKGVEGIFSYLEASSGMFKMIFLIVFLNLIEDGSCILIDNAADGLDYMRSIYLPSLVERAAKNKQIILCSNNEMLLNQTNIRNWNVVYRQGPGVTAFNYENSKDKLLKFADTGLSSYEYFKEEYFL